MNSSQFYGATQLADTHSIEVLYHALAIAAVRETQMMLGDFVKDPAYIAEQGIPTRESFVNSAVMYMCETHPIVVGDEMASVAGETEDTPGESPFACVCRLAVANVLRQYPELRKISIDL
jgi:hypothetical protein